MTSYRDDLPQLQDELFVTDGGLETTLMFHDGIELPDFAAFHLLRSAEGEARLRHYFRSYAELAHRHGVGLILESATWRASSDWGKRLGYRQSELAAANHRAIELLADIRGEFGSDNSKIIISGCIGPRGDGYLPGSMMSAAEAQQYHAQQIEVLQDSSADMLAALTLNYTNEAVGIVRAAERFNMPIAISFTVETDGRLPAGQTLGEAITEVDSATDGYASYFMINCAHPTHFEQALLEEEPWTQRIRGIRCNASRKSHAELNESTELDSGNPAELAVQTAELKHRLPQLTVLGGCCGTDQRHIAQIATRCAPLFHQSH